MGFTNSNGLELVMLGIDPGLQRTGWGIVMQSGLNLSHIAHGTIKTQTTSPAAERLHEIHRGLVEVIANWHPNNASIEKIFVAKSADSAIKLGMARGVAMQACAGKGIVLRELSAKQAKKSVTGTGAADKTQVASMVEKLLCVKPEGPDAADALAIAIAGINIGPKYSSDGTNSGAINGLTIAIETALAKQKRR